MQELKQIGQILSGEEPKVGPPPAFNRQAIRRHALKVSQETRNGKFDRVSQDFINKIEGVIEAELRGMRADLQNTPFGQVEVLETFLTGEGKRKLAEAFNIFVGNAIYRAVNATRVGKTL